MLSGAVPVLSMPNVVLMVELKLAKCPEIKRLVINLLTESDLSLCMKYFHAWVKAFRF